MDDALGIYHTATTILFLNGVTRISSYTFFQLIEIDKDELES